MKDARGFTLLELLIILVVIAILVTIALPSLLGSRVSANENAAFATVRTIVQAQLAFVNRKEADLNQNGTGEFGTFGEMSGNVAVRAANGGTKFMTPSTINPSFRAISPIGEMLRNGYYYRVYLPSVTGDGLIEKPGGGADETVDPELAETYWSLYAWPQRHGVSGVKTFFANHSGDIHFTEDPTYSGPGAPLTAGSALLPGAPATKMLGGLASGVTGRDGNVWHPAGG